MTDEDVSHALDAIKAAVRDLVSLTASDEAEQLLLEADALRARVESWRDTPPSAVEREQVMGRTVRLREAAASSAQGPSSRSPSAPPPSGVQASAAVNVPPAAPVPQAVGPIATASFVLPEALGGAAKEPAMSSTPDLASPDAIAEVPGEPLPRPTGLPRLCAGRAVLVVGATVVALVVGGWAARTWIVRHRRAAPLAVEASADAGRSSPPVATSVAEPALPQPEALPDGITGCRR